MGKEACVCRAAYPLAMVGRGKTGSDAACLFLEQVTREREAEAILTLVFFLQGGLRKRDRGVSATTCFIAPWVERRRGRIPASARQSNKIHDF